MSDMIVSTEAEAVAQIVEGSALRPQIITVTHEDRTAQVLITPAVGGGVNTRGVKVFLDEHERYPERRKGSASFTDLSSFIDHVNRFKGESSALFADDSRDEPKLVSVLNYHPGGPQHDPGTGEAEAASSADWADHRGVYTFPLADEWTTWLGQSKGSLSQAAFAEFLEARLLDIADPALAGDSSRRLADTIGASFATPARLLELSRGLSVRVGSAVKNAVNLATGEAQINFATEHTDDRGQPLKVPSAFLLAIPVFRGGDLYQIAARLRYRVQGGAVSWSFELHGADRIFDHAFREACEDARARTELPLFYGQPEA